MIDSNRLVENEKRQTTYNKSPEAEEIVEEKKKEPSIIKILAFNKPEWPYIVIGCFACIISGGVSPAFGVIFAQVISIYQECDIHIQETQITLYCIIFMIFGVGTFFSNLIQSTMFGFSGENLTKRLRSRGFRAMLSQDMAWFDDPKNNVGALCTRLSTEAAAVQGATGSRLGYVIQTFGNLGLGLVIAFVYGWALTLVILGFLPLLIAAGWFQTKRLTGFSQKDKEILEEAGKITSEAISNIRTVSILNKEKKFVEEYKTKIAAPYKAAMRSANIFGFMFGFTNSISFYAQGAAFAFGAYLITIEWMNFNDVIIVFSALIFGAQSAGQAASFLPDYGKAKAAAIKMIELFEKVPKINNWESTSNVTIPDRMFNGDIVFHKLKFHYPSRPNVTVLDNLMLSIKKGQRVALVGSSGCGKSTVTQLLERFYDSDQGSIYISGFDIRQLNLFWLRSQIGLVSQEPILFDTSIAENIAYGCDDGEINMQKIVYAARQANIHDFIMKLPEGYQTNVGSKGAQLSGGQKQRVAIARALIRNPKILILDEATSALDNESEKIVEEALERAQKGRTCIVIAHRLSTIQNADVIYVLKDGNIVESGTHTELLNRNGFYANLYKKNN